MVCLLMLLIIPSAIVSGDVLAVLSCLSLTSHFSHAWLGLRIKTENSLLNLYFNIANSADHNVSGVHLIIILLVNIAKLCLDLFQGDNFSCVIVCTPISWAF